MKMEIKVLMTVLVWGTLAAGASAEWFGLFGDDDAKIAVKDLPPAVVQAVQRVFPQGEMKRAEKEEKDKRVSYEVKVVSGEFLYSMETKADGTLIMVEREKRLKKHDDDGKEIKLADLPESVRAAAAKTFPNGKIKEADCKTKSGRTVYEVEVKDNGVEQIVSVSAEGTVLGVTKSDDEDKD
ncbi:MAG: PepSY domain-containing protein [Kiritimatiellales bacterium]